MEEDAILAAIAAHPGEDTPRLAYADWLDEHAADLPDPPSARIRAEFIRVQHEIKKYEHLPSSQQQGYADLYRRQDALLTRHRRDLLGPLADDLGPHDAVFDRGFVTELKLNVERFLKHADAIAALKPLPEISVVGDVPRSEFQRSPHIELVTALQGRSVIIDPGDVNYLGGPPTRTMSRLRELRLDECQIGDLALQVLANSPDYPVLTHLDLSWNEISDTGVLSLVNSLLWPRLKFLNLDANPISDEGAFSLADAPPTTIEYLNIRRTGIGHAGQQRLLCRKGWNVALF